MKRLLVLMLFFVLPAMASERTRVPAAEIVKTANAWLEAKAKEENVQAHFELVSHVNDLQLNTTALPTTKIGDLKAGWLRPRIAIPVQVMTDGKVISTMSVWFSVTAPHAGLLYAKNYNKATPLGQLSVQLGTIDLAKTKGKAITSLDGLNNMRLRQAVITGQALKAEDFEIIPTIQAQQSVRVETRSGAVHLSVPGRALADASIGEIVQVLPTNAAQPVRARVVSQQVVVIEN
jgi:flagellar basal body P-ring formation protein FlgA